MKAEIGWQDIAGERWAALQSRTDAQLGPLGRAAMGLVAPVRGERALDVGCGAGESTLELAELVGPAGSVVGVDVSEPLLTAARERVRASGHSQVELVLGNAATERYAQPFDLVFSRFGVMFFEDSVAAFANLRAALKPGGRLGFVCWQALAQNPWAEAPLAAVRALKPEHPVPELLAPGRPGPFALSSAPLVQDLLEAAGFRQIRVTPDDRLVPIGGARTLDEAVDYSLQIGPAARFIADAELAEDPRVRGAIAGALAPFASDVGVLVPARTFFVRAERE
jgi:SAM-dependent methyltransferase